MLKIFLGLHNLSLSLLFNFFVEFIVLKYFSVQFFQISLAILFFMVFWHILRSYDVPYTLQYPRIVKNVSKMIYFIFENDFFIIMNLNIHLYACIGKYFFSKFNTTCAMEFAHLHLNKVILYIKLLRILFMSKRVPDQVLVKRFIIRY